MIEFLNTSATQFGYTAIALLFIILLLLIRGRKLKKEKKKLFECITSIQGLVVQLEQKVDRRFAGGEAIPDAVEHKLYNACLTQFMESEKVIKRTFPALTDEKYIEAMRRVIFDMRKGTERNSPIEG